MANAKRCDICGKYFTLPEFKSFHNTLAGKVELYHMVVNKHHAADRVGVSFDACDDCVQEIMDHILTKKADWETIKDGE